MATREVVQRVRIYLSDHDRWEGQPLHLAVLNRLRREGATGATALRGVAGFGPSHRTRVTSNTDASERAPIVLEWIDRVERIAHMLPLLDDLLGDALVTIEDIQVYRAMLRASGPFASDYSVGDFIQPNPTALSPAASLGEGLALMLQQQQHTLPIVDEQRRVVGIVTEQDMMRRAGLRLPIELFPLLTPNEQQELLAPVTHMPVAEIMNTEMRSVYINAPIPQALVILLEWNYEQIPVLDRDGAFVGLFGREDVLRAAAQQSAAREQGVRDADPPTPVSLVMQTSVPYVAVTQPLAVVLHQILGAANHYVVVVDAAGRVQGSLSVASVLRHLRDTERSVFLAALLESLPADANSLPGTDRGIEGMLESERHTITPQQSITEAMRYLLEHQLKQTPVVDPEGKLLGLLSRGGLLRALGQASEV